MSKKSQPLQSRSRLGRGLSSLIAASTAAADPEHYQPPEAPPAPAGGGIGRVAAQQLAIDQIAPNPYQPRREFPADDLAELAASIARQGILQPLLVAPASEPAAERPYVLVAGERRLRAARQAGLANVPCIIRHATARQLLEWSLIENIQRSDLNPVERAQAYRDYMDRFSLTQEQLAERTGQARPTIANYLRILDLCDDVQGLLLAGQLAFGHARALAGLAGEPQRQLALARRAARDGLSVRQVERLAAAVRSGSYESAPAKSARPKAPYLRDLEARLTQLVGTRVSILPGRAKHTGRIVIDYYSLDDFDRIGQMLGLTVES